MRWGKDKVGMRGRAARCAFLAACIVLTAAQQDKPQPSGQSAFEVASIRVNRSGEQRITYQFARGGRFIAGNAPLRFLIAMAFRIQDFRISGAPA